MFKKYIGVALAATLTFSTGGALAANPSAVLNITQSDGQIWQENVTNLLVVDAQNNFSLTQGSSATPFFQNGVFVTTVNLASHPDYWQWNATESGGNWSWHSAQTLSGTTPVVTDVSNPWMSVLTLNNVSGNGDPDLSYAISAANNSTRAQTYTFAVGEEILPEVNAVNAVHADIAGGMTAKGGGTVTIAPFGTNTAIQKFQLSADSGINFVDTSVNVGPQASATGTTTYGTFTADAAGPTGQTWNYMQLLSTFTLTANSRASLVGYASISPVPEPATFAMMFGGLGLIGFVGRRRKNKQA